ncbi:hypothetical protein AAFN85_12000 [Mucilaginibacter sp. CAU 1740]|uniref:hypothetical protein n=1 Tax=Mucilaginibacter sp. CAU 1740 TaxID=3140365 RepID=UPI00325BD549
MDITYTSLGQEITEQQAMVNDWYEKVYSLNGVVKKKELYVDYELAKIEYYLELNETEEEAKAILSGYGVGYGILRNEQYGNYMISMRKGYVDNLLNNKSKILKDSHDHTVCVQGIDIETGTPDYKETIKYLGEYLGSNEGDYCRFNYKEDGSFDYCDYNYFHEYDSEQFNLEHVSMVKDLFQLSDEMYNYFLIAEFLPPISLSD